MGEKKTQKVNKIRCKLNKTDAPCAAGFIRQLLIIPQLSPIGQGTGGLDSQHDFSALVGRQSSTSGQT